MAITNSGRTASFTDAANAGNNAAAAVLEPSRFAGHWYFELTIDALSDSNCGGGLVNSNWVFTDGLSGANAIGLLSLRSPTQISQLFINGIIIDGTPGFKANDTIRFAVDLDNGFLYVQVGGEGFWNNSSTADPTLGMGGYDISSMYSAPSLPLVPAVNLFLLNDQVTGRFVNSDLLYAIPSGYSSWADGVAGVGQTGTRTGTFGGTPTTGQFGVSIVLVPALRQLVLPPPIPIVLDPVDLFEIIITSPGDGQFVVPIGISVLDSVEVWGAGGAGGDSGGDQPGGGGSGAYAEIVNVTVTPGTSYNYHVGKGGMPNYAGTVSPAGTTAPSGEDSWFSNQSTILAKGGGGGNNDSGGTGTTSGGTGGTAAASIGTTVFNGATGGRGKAGHR